MYMEVQLSLNLSVKYPTEPREEVVLAEWTEWNLQNDQHELELLRRQK